MDISVIIVNYNTLELTKKSIDSVFQFKPMNLDITIILVDNASNDGSKEYFEKEERITYIYSEENLGFGRANNIGIKNSESQYIFLLNSDAYLIEDIFTPFYNFMEKPENKNVACCGANIIDGNGDNAIIGGNLPSIKESIARVGFAVFFLPYYKKYLASGIKHFEDKGKVYEIDYVSGAGMFLRKEVLDKVGLFDPHFFLYYEETELSYRIFRGGYKSMILSNYSIVHFQGSSSKNKSLNRNIEKIFSESRFIFFEKCYNRFSARLITIIFFIQSIIFGIIKMDEKQLIKAKIILKTLK